MKCVYLRLLSFSDIFLDSAVAFRNSKLNLLSHEIVNLAEQLAVVGINDWQPQIGWNSVETLTDQQQIVHSLLNIQVSAEFSADLS